MRIWLDADLLNKYKLTPVDVINQLKVQNDQIAAGQLGGTPALPGQQLNASIIAQTRLKNPEEFGKVTLRVNSDGSVVRLKDVARVELGGENYNVIARINGKPAAGLVLSWQPAQMLSIPRKPLRQNWRNYSHSSRRE